MGAKKVPSFDRKNKCARQVLGFDNKKNKGTRLVLGFE